MIKKRINITIDSRVWEIGSKILGRNGITLSYYFESCLRKLVKDRIKNNKKEVSKNGVQKEEKEGRV